MTDPFADTELPHKGPERRRLTSDGCDLARQCERMLNGAGDEKGVFERMRNMEDIVKRFDSRVAGMASEIHTAVRYLAAIAITCLIVAVTCVLNLVQR